LGTARDTEIAKRLKRDAKEFCRKRCELGIASVVERRFWTPEEAALVGKLSDAAVASRLGRTKGDVAAKRRQIGADYSARQKCPWTEAEDKLLGTEADESLAQRLGRTVVAVGRRRANLRIARFGAEAFRPRPGYDKAKRSSKLSRWTP
jgi:hypothetical protein